MGLKKKRNILVAAGACFSTYLTYQMYFFIRLSSNTLETVEPSLIRNILPLRSRFDLNIDENGVIRGVLLTDMKHYRPEHNNEFKCLSSGEIISYELVNDDYCDCEDFSDEPSTTACEKGLFHCRTQLRDLKHTVPSSVVNDGICDCCDGSDEWIQRPDKRVLTQGTAVKSRTLVRHYAEKCPNVC